MTHSPEPTRVLARNLAREINTSELNKVSGGRKCDIDPDWTCVDEEDGDYTIDFVG